MTTATAIQPVQLLAGTTTDAAPRPRWLPVLPALCMIPAGVSWLAGGSHMFNDISWIAMTLVCIFYAILELKAFPHRLGVGGIVLFLGILGWFCWDYLQYWFAGTGGPDLIGQRTSFQFEYSTKVLAKATFMHFLFFTMATIGLLIRRGWWLPRLIARTPQPANPPTLLALIVALFLLSLMPYFLFSTKSGLVAIWETHTSFAGEMEGLWTVGRTGRLNVAWGGYVANWMDLDKFAAVLAVFYALFMSRWWPTKLLCWSMWMFVVMRVIGTGSRGQMLEVAIPVLLLVFIRYHLQAAEYYQFRAHRVKAYALSIALFIGVFAVIQIQAYNRRGSLREASLSLSEFANPKNNTMFTSSLAIFDLVPKEHGYFYNRFPGEGWVRPIPQTVFEFVTGPIPRALWHNKPIDEVNNWVNIVKGGAVDFGAKGPTLSNGLVGWYWARYGVGGVIEGGLLWGWLLLVIDRAIWLSRRKPLILIIALGMAAFMFRSYRDPRWMALYQFLIGIAGLWFLSLFTKKSRLEDPGVEHAPHA